jgi:hypothetical protein
MADKPVTINTSIDLGKVPEIDINLSSIKEPKTETIINAESSKDPKTGTILSTNQNPMPKNTGIEINLIEPKGSIKTGTKLSAILDPKTFARQ